MVTQLRDAIYDFLNERSAQGQILKPLTKDEIYLVSLFRVNRAKKFEQLLVNEESAARD